VGEAAAIGGATFIAAATATATGIGVILVPAILAVGSIGAGIAIAVNSFKWKASDLI
jgi:hypothetical protein